MLFLSMMLAQAEVDPTITGILVQDGAAVGAVCRMDSETEVIELTYVEHWVLHDDFDGSDTFAVVPTGECSDLDDFFDSHWETGARYVQAVNMVQP